MKTHFAKILREFIDKEVDITGLRKATAREGFEQMPRPKGFEPYTRVWIVRWDVRGSRTSGVTWPRVQVMPSELSANAKITFLQGLVGSGEGSVVAGSMFIAEAGKKYFNRKQVLCDFVSGLAESVQASG